MFTHYVLFIVTTTAIFAIIGAGIHFLRAIIGVDERPIVHSGFLYRLSDHWFARSVMKAEFTDNGAWEMFSIRNLAICVLSSASVPLLIGILWWSQRAEVLSVGCKAYGWLGLQPLFCG